MNNNKINISEIANSILANDESANKTLVFLPLTNKKAPKDYCRLFSEIALKITEEEKNVLLVAENDFVPRINSSVEVCYIDSFLKCDFETKTSEYDLVMILSPRFDESATSQTLVRKSKSIVLIIEEFLSTEENLANDMKEINNLGAEVLGAIYVER